MKGMSTAPGREASTRNWIWLFDLDETLYPRETGLMEAVSQRISRFIEERLGLPSVVAEAVREAYFGRYGSSVQGVLRHCQVDPEAFLTFVHDVPVTQFLRPDPDLDHLLTALPGRKFIFTNAPEAYAHRVLRALGVAGHFDAVFGLHFLGLQGKPSPLAYERVLNGVDGRESLCWFVEDSLTNLVPAKALGCRTVWVRPEGPVASPYADFVIQRLSQLLEVASQAMEAAPHDHLPTGY